MIDDLDKLYDWLVNWLLRLLSGYLGGYGCYTNNQLLLSLTSLRISFDWFVEIVIEFVRVIILVIIIIPNIS